MVKKTTKIVAAARDGKKVAATREGKTAACQNSAGPKSAGPKLAGKDFDFLVFIGRFEPLHSGHKYIIDKALGLAGTVLVFVGSANRSRSIYNPFTYGERLTMIAAVFAREIADGRLIVKPIDDHPYNDTAWIADVQRIVKQTVLDAGNRETPKVHLHGLGDFKVGLAGYGKDGSSYYLKLFPEWKSVNIDSQYGTFNATDIRADYFRRAPVLPHDNCPTEVVDFLKDFRLTKEFKDLVAEAEYIAGYRKSWAQAPFAPTFITVDAVVVQSGHVLMVERGEGPGRGLLALPGGFINADEPIRNAAIRELKEETRIADARGEIPPGLLSAYIEDRKTRVFDDPNRSLRGRTVTHAHYFNCPPRKELFSVRSSDDAARALWVPIGTLDPTQCFEDHFFIIEEMTGI